MVKVEVELILGIAVHIFNEIEAEQTSCIVIKHAGVPVETGNIGGILYYRIERRAILDLIQVVILLPTAKVVETPSFVSKFNEALVAVNLADVGGV